ncbi:MAG: thermonuclease family protein, partial [Armatimonadota bacterium]|nr:thermonuclease family protein [Armatimonadota bacterium]
MARRSRSSYSSRRPWWMVLLIAAAAWIYNHYFQRPQAPTPRRERTTRSAREGSSREGSSREGSRRAPRQTRESPVEGGRLITDVVERISDGDTVKLRRTGTVRLIGVDTPEKAQEGGPEAKEFTRRALEGQTVQVELCARQPHDRYGRG